MGYPVATARGSDLCLLFPISCFSDLNLLDRKKIIRPVYIHWEKMQSMSLSIFHKRCGGIKSERVVIEHRRHETCTVMDYEIRRRICEQRKAVGVRFWKAVVSERLDAGDDLVLCRLVDVVARHPGPQVCFDLLHSSVRPFEAHRASQFFGLTARKPGDV